MKVLITPLLYTNDFEKKEIEVKRLNINKVIKELYGYEPSKIIRQDNRNYIVDFAYTTVKIETKKSWNKKVTFSKNWKPPRKEKEKERRCVFIYRIQYNKDTISIRKLCILKGINYNNILSIKNRTGKDYIDILREKYNICIEKIGKLYYLKWIK